MIGSARGACCQIAEEIILIMSLFVQWELILLSSPSWWPPASLGSNTRKAFSFFFNIINGGQRLRSLYYSWQWSSNSFNGRHKGALLNDELLRLFSIGKAMKAKSAPMVFCRWNEPVLKARRGIVQSKRPVKVWQGEDMTDSESRYGNSLCLHTWSIYAWFCSGSQTFPRRSAGLSISFPFGVTCLSAPPTQTSFPLCLLAAHAGLHAKSLHFNTRFFLLLLLFSYSFRISAGFPSKHFKNDVAKHN